MAKCKFDGTVRRVNGQHTSRIFSDPSFQYGQCTINYTTWECDTEVDLALVNAKYDRPANNRGPREVYSAFSGAVPTLKGATKATINLCVQGIACAKYGKRFTVNRTIDEKALGLVGQDDFCGFARGLLEARRIPQMAMFRRYAIVTAMYKTFTEDPVAALEFWTAVMSASGQTNKMPDRRLNTWIITNKNKSIQAANGRDRSEVIEHTCLRYWQTWYKSYNSYQKVTASE